MALVADGPTSTRRAVEPPRSTVAATLLDGLRAVAEPTRLRIVALLQRGERTVSEIAHILGQSQPRVSRHMKILAEAGVVHRTAEGSWVFCRLTDADLVARLLPLLPADDPILRADAARLADLQRTHAEAAERYFREHADNWEAVRRWHVSEQDVEALFLDLIGPGPLGDLIDIGTGTGRILQLLAPRARRAIGIDRSAAMLAAARPSFDSVDSANVQLRQGDMARLPLDDRSADLVVMHQVLHFAADPAGAFREIGRIVRAAGRVIVVDFAPHQREVLRDEHGHRRLGFHTEEIVAWAAAAGLGVTNTHHLYGSPLTVVLWELRPIESASSPT